MADEVVIANDVLEELMEFRRLPDNRHGLGGRGAES